MAFVEQFRALAREVEIQAKTASQERTLQQHTVLHLDLRVRAVEREVRLAAAVAQAPQALTVEVRTIRSQRERLAQARHQIDQLDRCLLASWFEARHLDDQWDVEA